MTKLSDILFRPVSIGSMVYCRIIFGIIMLIEVFRYFKNDWIRIQFIKPKYLFKYWGFEWVTPLSQTGMNIVFILIGLTSILIALGLFYRFSIVLFTFLFTYVFLLAKTHYLNHFYFIFLLSIGMCLVSPHLKFSFDVKRKPEIESDQCHFWEPGFICFVMGVVYFFGGIAKINPDWLNGNPLYFWLRSKNLPFYSHGQAVFMSWVGMLFDLLVPFLLVWKKSRVPITLCALVFHISNSFFFKIGIFPWFSFFLSFMYYDPAWPYKIAERFNLPFLKQKSKILRPISDVSKKLVLGFLTAFILYNLIMPIRHHFIGGDVNWDELGHRYAWRMKLRSKRNKAPTFYIVDNQSKEKWKIRTRDYLTKWQVRKMGGHPEMILEFAHHIRDEFAKKGHKDLSVYVKARASLNYRKYQFLIDKNFDLLTVEDCGFCSFPFIKYPKFLKEKNLESSKKHMKKKLNVRHRPTS